MQSVGNKTFWKPDIESNYRFDAEVVISEGDCVKILSKLPKESAKLIIDIIGNKTFPQNLLYQLFASVVGK